MNILVTGAKGMVGTALCNNLKNIRDGKNKTRSNLHVEEIYEYDLNSTPEELDEYCRKADFVFNLAGVNRPENPEDFMKGNFGFASDLLNCLKKHNNKATIMLSSSIQATLAGRFGNSEYGRSKKAGEELFFQYAQETGAKVAVYRFVNLMGHSRPKYNSAVSTFCWAVANDEPFTVNDRSTELELLYIDDLVEGMFDLLEGKEQHCEFDGVETVLQADGRYCCVPVTHKVTLGEIVDLLRALNSGHRGGMTTLHANQVTAVPSRLVALGLLAGLNPQATAALAQDAFDVVLHVGRVGGRRRIAQIGRLEFAEGKLRGNLLAGWNGDQMRASQQWPDFVRVWSR